MLPNKKKKKKERKKEKKLDLQTRSWDRTHLYVRDLLYKPRVPLV